MSALIHLRCAALALIALLTATPVCAEAAPLVVIVEGDGAVVDAEAVRREIARELRVPVTDANTSGAAGTLVLTLEAGTVSARYTGSDGRELTRSLALPRHRAQRLEVIVWLAGNLARDEASQVAAELQPPAADSAAAPAASTPSRGPEPTPTPEPATVQRPAPPPPSRPRDTSKSKSKPAAATAPRRSKLRPPVMANLSLFHPIALYRDSELRRVHLELGLAYSRVGELSGLAANPGVVRVDGALQGALFSGLFSLLDGGADGIAASGLFSKGSGRLQGAEGAGIFVWRSGDVDGVQAAGIAVHAHDLTGAHAAGIVASARRTSGAQAAGLIASAGPLEGVQAAGVVARAEAIDGLQASGISSVAGKLEGLQIALVNVAGDVSGVQIGLVNIGARVSGAQIGLVNRAERVHGLSLAPVSALAENRTQAVLWADSVLAPNVGIRYRTDVLYSLFSVGLRPGNQDDRRFGAGGAIGLELGKFGPIEASADVLYRYLLPDFEGEPYRDEHSTVLRGLAAWDLGTLGVFAGLGAESRVRGDNSHAFRPYCALGVTVF